MSAFAHEFSRRLFAVAFAPFEALGSGLGLAMLSALSGVLLLCAFRVTSNPQAIRAARRRAQAHLLAVRLYRHDLGVSFRAQASFLSALGAYLGRMLLPLGILALPFALVCAQLEARYATRALRPREAAIVIANVERGAEAGWGLEATAGITLEAGPVRIPARGEISWRIRAVGEGVSEIALTRGGERTTKAIRVSKDLVGAAAVRSVASLGALFRAPAEAAIDASTEVRSIEVRYPPLTFGFAGVRLGWLSVFLTISTVVALILKRRVGAEF